MSHSMTPMEEAPKVKKERPDSLKKPPRASIFVEHHEVPHIWNRDSQSSYGGARSPSFLDNFETGSHMSIEPPGHYGGFEPTESGRQHAIGYAYEMPERYLGKGMPYNSEIAIPLTDNTWAPPVSQKRKWCGLGKTAIVVLCALICVLVVGGVIAGVVAGVVMSKQSIESGSKINSTGLTTQIATSASASTITLSNGSVVLTTLIITTTHVAESQTTTEIQSETQSSQWQAKTQSSAYFTPTSTSSLNSITSSSITSLTSTTASPTPSSSSETSSASTSSKN